MAIVSILSLPLAFFILMAIHLYFKKKKNDLRMKKGVKVKI